MNNRRISDRTLRVLQVFLDAPDQRHFSFEIAEAAGLRSGSIYPNLARLETLGWIVGGWEDADAAAAEQRRSRRCYWLSDEGGRSGARAVARWRLERPPTRHGRSAQPGEVHAAP